jgi:hypothetical protein
MCLFIHIIYVFYLYICIYLLFLEGSEDSEGVTQKRREQLQPL